MDNNKEKEGELRNELPTNTPPVVPAQEWEAARQQLLVKEKALMRARDAPRRRASADAVAGGGEGVRIRRAEG
jgi:hypothetical protein